MNTDVSIFNVLRVLAGLPQNADTLQTAIYKAIGPDRLERDRVERMRCHRENSRWYSGAQLGGVAGGVASGVAYRDAMRRADEDSKNAEAVAEAGRRREAKAAGGKAVCGGDVLADVLDIPVSVEQPRLRLFSVLSLPSLVSLSTVGNPSSLSMDAKRRFRPFSTKHTAPLLLSHHTFGIFNMISISRESVCMALALPWSSLARTLHMRRTNGTRDDSCL